MTCWRIGALLLFTTLSLRAAPLPSIVLDPVSSVAGGPGGNVGWGFTIHGDTDFWISILDVQIFGESSPVGAFFQYINGGPVDFAIPPTTDWSDYYSVTLNSGGLGSYQIDPGTPDGSYDTGAFIVHYEVYDDNPSSCGCSAHAGGPETLYLPAGSLDPGIEDPLNPGMFFPSFEINVETPEPGSWGLIGAGVILIAIGSSRRRRTGS